MKIFLILILLLTCPFTAFAQDKEPFVYQIKEIHQNADLNIKAIEKYGKRSVEWGDKQEILKLFKPIKGKYKILFFVGADLGISSINDKEHIFHELLILKVNKDNEILDGLQYVLEWAEMPFAYRLCRISKSGIKLQKEMEVSKFDCQNFESGHKIPLSGFLDNLYNFREVF